MKLKNKRSSVLDLPLPSGQILTVNSDAESKSFVPDESIIKLIVTSFNKDSIKLIPESELELGIIANVLGADEFVLKEESEEPKSDELESNELETPEFKDDSESEGLSKDDKVDLYYKISGTSVTEDELKDILEDLGWNVDVWLEKSKEFLTNEADITVN